MTYKAHYSGLMENCMTDQARHNAADAACAVLLHALLMITAIPLTRTLSSKKSDCRHCWLFRAEAH